MQAGYQRARKRKECQNQEEKSLPPVCSFQHLLQTKLNVMPAGKVEMPQGVAPCYKPRVTNQSVEGWTWSREAIN